MKVRAGIEVSSQSDIGCLRQNNEDSFGYWEPDDEGEFLRKGRLAVVADGMGGYEGGQEASRIAVERMIAGYRDFGGDDPREALVQALQSAHEEIRKYSFAHPELRGMGTTCTAIAIVKGQDGPSGEGAQYGLLFYVHVGDTRLYLVREGKITRITRDHSYVERLIEAGMITQEQADVHPQRNILTSAVGTNPDLFMDAPEQPVPLCPEDVLVICSDGLWGQVRDAEILNAVKNKSPEQAGRELIELARERGGPDNITVQILRLR
jgi:serine/threonine protein phosphatase PrpC